MLGIVYMQTNQFDNAIIAFEQAAGIFQKLTRDAAHPNGQRNPDYENALQKARMMKQRTLEGTPTGISNPPPLNRPRTQRPNWEPPRRLIEIKARLKSRG